METRDWIQIIAEVICNGVILAMLGKWLEIKMKRTERKEKTHNVVKCNCEISLGKWEELQKSTMEPEYQRQLVKEYGLVLPV